MRKSLVLPPCPKTRGPPEGFASSAVEPQNPDRGYFYFPEPVSVAGAKVRYFRESGGQVAGAELAVYTSEGVQMQTGAVATGCYLVEKRDGEVYAYCGRDRDGGTSSAAAPRMRRLTSGCTRTCSARTIPCFHRSPAWPPT